MTKTETFIEKHRKKLVSGSGFYNPDTSMMPVEKFETSKLKFLLIFPTPASVKTVSSTSAAINSYVQKYCPDVFIDFAYMPEGTDIKYYDQNNVPYAIGQITHLDPSHFDVIGFSISVLNEVVTAPVMLKTFDRCDTPIDLFWSDRKDKSIKSTPLIYAGGITASCGDIMFGKVDNKQSFIDFLYLGEVDKTNIIFNRLIEAKETGKVTRNWSDNSKPGYELGEAPTDYQTTVEVNTVQDFIESLFDLNMIYQPQAYEVEYNKYGRIVKNVKINPKARDFVEPYYPHEMLDYLGVGQQIIPGSGENSGTTQIQVSNGAHAGWNRIRTSNGLLRIDELVNLYHEGDCDCSEIVDTTKGPHKAYHKFNQGIKSVRTFTLKSGIKIGLTDEHPVEQWHLGNSDTTFVRADSLKRGDFFMTKRSEVFGNHPATTYDAEMIGRIVGKGYFEDDNLYLECPLSDCEDLINLSNNSNFILLRDTTTHNKCRFLVNKLDKNGRSLISFWGFDQPLDTKIFIKQLPSSVFEFREECIKSFLKGLHDTVGSVYYISGNPKITFNCICESITNDVQQLLLMVGIASRKGMSMFNDERTFEGKCVLYISPNYFNEFKSLNTSKQIEYKEVINDEPLPFDENVVDLLSANLTDYQLSKFSKAVMGDLITKSLADELGLDYPKDIIFDEIVNIEFSEEPTYDLSVKDVERLIANGCSVHNCSASGQCSFMVLGDTRIWTEDGLIPIKDSKAFQVTAIKDLENIKRIAFQGEAKLFYVYTSNGFRLGCDENHKFVVVEGDKFVEKRAFELNQGDVVLRRLGSPEVKDSFIKDKNFAEFLGFMHGDGCLVGERWQMFVDEGELDHYTTLFKKYVPTNSKPCVHYQSENSTIYQISGKPVDYGFDIAAVKSEQAYVPECIFRSSHKIIASYLKGLFQADGWFNTQIGLTSVSEQLIRDVAQLLQAIGIDSVIGYNSYYEKVKSGNHKPSWYVTIPKYYHQKFIDLVGFHDKSHSLTDCLNRTKSNLVLTEELKTFVKSNFKSREEARSAGFGSFYESNKKVSDRVLTRLSNLEGFKSLSETPQKLVASGRFVTDTISSIKSEDRIVPMYDVIDSESHLCVYDGILTHQCHEGAYCLPKGSLIKTSEGLKAIEEIKIGDNVVLNDVLYPVHDTIVSGVKPVINFLFENNQNIRVANTHLILTIQDGVLVYKRAYDIKEGDYVAYERSRCFGHNTTDIAFLCGILFGCGKLYPSINTVEINISKSKYDKISDLLTKFVEVKTVCSSNVLLLSKDNLLIDELNRLGITEETLNSKRIPSWFYNASEQTLKQFLKGLFFATGCIHSRDSISFTSIQNGLVETLTNLLSMFGVYVNISEQRDCVMVCGDVNINRLKDIINTENYQTELFSDVVTYLPTFTERLKKFYDSNESFRAYVSDQIPSLKHTLLYNNEITKEQFELISQVIPIDIYLDIVEAFKYEYYKVTGIFYESSENMYDINVDGSNAYSLCGWVSHNTGGWVEKPKEDILRESLEAKKYSAGYKMKPYSFNMVHSDTYLPVGSGRFTKIMNLFNSPKENEVVSLNSPILNGDTKESFATVGVVSTKHKWLDFKLSKGNNMRLSLEHKQPVLTENGLEVKLAKDIKVGDYIPQFLGYYKNFTEHFTLSLKDYFLGLWYGTGKSTNYWKSSIQSIESLTESVKSNIEKYKPYSSIDEYTFTYTNEYHSYFNEVFPNYKFADNNLHLLSINSLLSFIKGWSDSCKSEDFNGFIKFHECDRDIVRLVVLVLQSVGINCSILEDDEQSVIDLIKSGIDFSHIFDDYVDEDVLPSLFGLYTYNSMQSVGEDDKYFLISFFSGYTTLTVSKYKSTLSHIKCPAVELFNKGVRFSEVQSVDLIEEPAQFVDINEPLVHTYQTEFGLTHNCLENGTFIPTIDGIKRVEDVNTGDTLFNFTSQTGFKQTTQVKHTKLYKPTLDVGIAPWMSANHRQWVFEDGEFKYKPAESLKKDDLIISRNGFISPLTASRGSKAYFLGLWYGDGTRSGDNSNKWISSRQFIASHELELKKICDSSNYFKYKDNENRTDGVRSYTYTEEFSDYIKSIFPEYKSGRNNLTSLSWQEIVDFIAGFYDADGSSSDNTVDLTNSKDHYKVLEFVAVALNAMGIRTSLRKNKWSYGDGTKYGYSIRLVGKKSYELFWKHISFAEQTKATSFNRTFNTSKCVDKSIPRELGPVLEKKIREIDPSFVRTTKMSHFLLGKQGMLFERFKELFSKYSNDIDIIDMILNGVTLQRVKSVEVKEGDFDTTDLIETEDHAFCAGTIITHNCNYLTDYKGMLGEFVKLYPKTTFINMRMEELGRDPDALVMMKMIGSNRLSCLDKDTLITTQRGLIPIKDVVPTDTVLSLEFDDTPKGGRANHREVWSKVIAVKNQGIKPLYKVTFENGNYVIATEDHLLLTSSDCEMKSRYTDVQVKDILKSPNKRLFESRTPNVNSLDEIDGVKLTEDLMFMLGWLTGDGYTPGNLVRFYFGEKDNEVIEYVRQALLNIGIQVKDEFVEGEYGPVTRFTVGTKWFVDFVNTMGLYGVSKDKTFPEKVFISKTSLQYAFLRGYFSADGNVKFGKENNRTTCCIRCSSISPSILRGLTLVLNNLGIMTSQTEWVENTGTFENSNSVNLISSLYVVSPLSIERFIQNIGFHQTYKRENLKCSSVEETRFSVKVKSVEYLKDDECWDIQVEGAPYFAANNVFVHNCPLEGMSPRIMNNLLNKCLSEEAIEGVMDYCVHGKMQDVKVGMIFTAYEQDEDYKWITDFFDKYNEKAKTEGGSFTARLKACATNDALTPIKGKGLVRQSEITKNNSIIGYTDSTVLETKVMGESEVYEITTDLGTKLKVTSNHPILTEWTGESVEESHYTKANQLNVGDSIYMRIGTNCYGTYQKVRAPYKEIVLDEWFAYLLGASFLGMSSKNVITLKPKTESESFNLRAALNRLNITSTGSTSCIDIDDINYITLCREIFTVDHQIPSIILQSPKSVQTNFIKGMLSVEEHSNDVISLTHQNVQDIQVMLFNMGIKTILTDNTLNFCSQIFDDFYSPAFDHLSSDNTESIISCTITSIKTIPSEATYGLEVANHSYLTNGILSHNTPLVCYSNTVCEYLERKSAYKSFMGERWLTDEQYENLKEHNVHFKVNGFRYSTFLEQSIVDQGRRLTGMIYNHFVKNTSPIYSLRSIATEEFVHELSLLADPYHYTENLTEPQKEEQKNYIDGYFGDRNPESYISPVHRIHIELMGSYISRAKRLLKAKSSGDIFSMEPDIRCLKTYDGAPVRCLKNCMKKEPFKVYKDVSLEDGKLVGEYRNLEGCERCQTHDQQKARLDRPIVASIDSKGLAAIPRIPQVQKLRFVLNRLPLYDVLNPNNTAHTFITKFLQMSDNLLKAYHSMNVHNMFWQSDPLLSYVVSGVQVVDTIWSKDVYSEVKSLIPEVNKQLKSVQVVSVSEEMRDEKIKIDDINMFYFESSLPYALFESAKHSYKGTIKVAGGMGTMETITDKSLTPPVFISKGKVCGVFALPVKYNPDEYLSAFLSSSKKTSTASVVDTTSITSLLLVRETKAVCKKCGNEHAMVSVITGKPLAFGKECLSKALLAQKLK